jgi:hypothetical protein
MLDKTHSLTAPLCTQTLLGFYVAESSASVDCDDGSYLHFELPKLHHALLGDELYDMIRVLLDQLLHCHRRQLRGCYLNIVPSTCSSTL